VKKTEKDYEEFLTLLNKHKVRYCIIGAFALAFHARPRYTKDIDRQNLIKSKKLSDRIQDKADLELILSNT
jgi:hypothetical protein